MVATVLLFIISITKLFTNLSNFFAEIEGHLVSVHGFKVEQHQTVSLLEAWDTDQLQELVVLPECFFAVRVHRPNEEHVWNLSALRGARVGFFVIFVSKVQTGLVAAGVKDERVTVLEWVDAESVWSCRAEVPHLKDLFHPEEALASLSGVIWRLRVQKHVTYVLATSTQEVNTIDLKLVRVGDQVDALPLLLCQPRE